MNSNNKCRGVAQFGSALVSGTRGREFESRRPDQIENVETRMVMRVFLFLWFCSKVQKQPPIRGYAIFMQYLTQNTS